MLRSLIDRISQHEEINFILTNRIPRRLATRFVGWFSRIENPLVREFSIGVWKLFAGNVNLAEAKKTTFTSLHDCFIRELKEGVRPIDRTPGILVSPCDAIVGASGTIHGGELIQAKGSAYTIQDLLEDPVLAERYRNGCYVTLRLTAGMYHRFHSPCDCDIEQVIYISGDTWNVNPSALKRVERLYCRNERVVIDARVKESHESVALVPVAAILVACIHLNFLDAALNLTYDGPRHIACHVALRRGEEMGHFRLGSTIIVLASSGFERCQNVQEGALVRMGQPLLRHV
jgi:phosphatidylserine decarboxylase